MRSNALQGADEWDNREATDIPPSNHDIAGPRITKKAIAKLDALAQSKQRFAMLVHLFDPHSTYMEHPAYKYVEHGTASLVEKYDYEVAFDDGLIGEILDALDKNGLAANTTVVVMADHGEAFGVHALYGNADFFHGDSLYAELTHVPLMFRVPGVAPCVAHDVVQLVDLAPTIAELMGATAPKSWVGRSLAPALACTPGALPAKPAFSELLADPEWDHEAKAMVTPTASTTSTTGRATRSGRSTISRPTPTRRRTSSTASRRPRRSSSSSRSGSKARSPPAAASSGVDHSRRARGSSIGGGGPGGDDGRSLVHSAPAITRPTEPASDRYRPYSASRSRHHGANHTACKLPARIAVAATRRSSGSR